MSDEPLSLPPQQGIPMIEIITAEGSAPRTRQVELSTAMTHVAAKDRLAGEAEILVAYFESEDCETRDPCGYLLEDKIFDGRFIFDEDELAELDRQGAPVVAVRVIDEVSADES